MIGTAFRILRILMLLVLMVFLGCEEAWHEPFEVFQIREGNHYPSSLGSIQALQSDHLYFEAIFDSSAIYKNTIPENQHDINKLVGFSDCNSHHHQHSARFGWRWLDNQLEILGYCYVNGDRMVQSIGFVGLNEAHSYSIRITDDHYLFQLDQLKEVAIQRERRCKVGLYYLLYPYFGGTEAAPHDIFIRIKLDYTS